MFIGAGGDVYREMALVGLRLVGWWWQRGIGGVPNPQDGDPERDVPLGR